MPLRPETPESIIGTIKCSVCGHPVSLSNKQLAKLLGSMGGRKSKRGPKKNKKSKDKS